MHSFLGIDYLGSDDMSDVKKQHYVPQFYLIGRLPIRMVFFMRRGVVQMGLDLSFKPGRMAFAPKGIYTRLRGGFQRVKSHLLKRVRQSTCLARTKR